MDSLHRRLNLVRLGQLNDDDLSAVVKAVEQTIVYGDGWLQRLDDGRLQARDSTSVVITSVSR